MLFLFFCFVLETGLNFKSNLDPNANIVQKYPIVWWTNLILLTILVGSFWAYYIRKENIDFGFNAWCSKFPELAMWGGFGVIIVVFIILLIILMKQTWKKGQ